MNRFGNWIMVGLLALVPQFAGCQKSSDAEADHEPPAKVVHIEGSTIAEITLTKRAMERLDVQTGAVTEEKSPRADAPQKAVPYAAIWYDPHGNVWVYTSPTPGVFVRAAIEVDHILGDLAYLTDGPEVGTIVATVAVAELYGTEFEVGH